MKRNVLATLGAMAILLSACAGATTPSLTSFELPKKVDVTFSALLPENTPAGEDVVFTILDEVTGIDLNSTPLVMKSSGEHSVVVSVSAAPGTLLKYRYARQSANGSVQETAANGERIDYRAYYIDGPGHLAHDVIAAWADLPTEMDSGQVSGSVSDAASGSPLSGLTAVAAGRQAQTDGEGHFLIDGLPQGLHNILIYAPDGSYMPFQQGALVAANNETPAAIQLEASPMADVTFVVGTPADHTAGTPVFMTGNLEQLAAHPLLSVQEDGSYTLSLQLPVGVDIRYKYTLGDGLWNAEHLTDGNFAVRQIVIPQGTSSLTINDQIESWTAGSAAPIWFELTGPADSLLTYIQFKLGDWSTPLPMWPLGEGHWAYRLNSPTNFAQPLEYRYCQDAACTVLEAAPGDTRSVVGNQETLQEIKDSIESWQH